MNHAHVYELIGVGLGVFNLSLAALLKENDFNDVLFFEKQEQLNWHEGILLDSSELQVHYLKDLVTPVDPTSKYSFLNYLKERDLLYQFLNRKSESISRNQFQYYFRWVAQQLSQVRFNSTVTSITFDGEIFLVEVNGTQFRSRHIAVASGLDPYIPEYVSPHLGNTVFHASDYAKYKNAFGGKTITVVGGGQSGAEIVMDVLENSPDTSVQWFSRQLWFAQLEDNCFVNELYIPSFTKIFRQLSIEKKRDFVKHLTPSSDGINQSLIDRMYRLVYERRFFSNKPCHTQFFTGQEMVGLRPLDEGYEVSMESWSDQNIRHFETDIVVLATGYRPSSWRMLRGVLRETDDVCIGENFEVQWPHQQSNHIFVQNGSKMCVGLVDANLSVAAWRSSMIVNKLLNKERYVVHPDTPMVGHLLHGAIL